MVERWWKDKFFPYKRLVKQFRAIYWLDFILVASYLVAQISVLTYFGTVSSYSSVTGMIFIGFIIPFTVFCFMVGFSVYQQHTHENVPWFKTRDERDTYGHVEDITVHVRYPHWYNLISHNVMEHTAHHVDPRVPLYQLDKAQAVLVDMLGNKMMTIEFSLKSILETMRRCKLYDYENYCWLDFEGKPTSKKTVTTQKLVYAHAA